MAAFKVVVAGIWGRSGILGLLVLIDVRFRCRPLAVRLRFDLRAGMVRYRARCVVVANAVARGSRVVMAAVWS